MRNRLQTLLTQFSIRDLLWAMVVAARIVAFVIRERATMRATLAAEVAADQARLQAQLDVVEQQRALLKQQASKVAAFYEEVQEILNKHNRKLEELDPSYPIYYPPNGK